MPSRVDYRAYLDSDHWKQKRSIALHQAGNRCQVCNEGGQLDVHHRTYERLGDELPQDLIVLCRNCHQLFHSNRTLEGVPSSGHGARLNTRTVIAALCGVAAVWSYFNMAQWSTYEDDPFNYMSRYILFWVLATFTACLAFPNSWTKITLGSIGLFSAIYILIIV